MAKMLAPSIRADFVPKHFIADKNSPKSGELNEHAIQFSLALTSGFYARFTESDTDIVTQINSYANKVVTLRENYEINASFFLDTTLFSNTSDPTSIAYSTAETMFFGQTTHEGFWVVRYGYKHNEPYAAGQEISMFQVINDLPRLLNDEKVYKLEVPFISKGFALNNYKLIA